MTTPPTWNPDELKGLDRAVRERLDAGEVRGAVALVVEQLGASIHGYLRTLLPEDDADEAYSEFQEDVMKGLPKLQMGVPGSRLGASDRVPRSGADLEDAEATARGAAPLVALQAGARVEWVAARHERSPRRAGRAAGIPLRRGPDPSHAPHRP